MDIDSVVSQVQAVVSGQLLLGGDEPSITAAGDAIMLVLEPALRQAGATLAEQAAAEVNSQLPDLTIDVVLAGGQPTLVVRDSKPEVAVNTDDLDARITVRLPGDLKEDLEDAAADLGDSVNTFVVRALAGKANAKTRSSRCTFEGTIET
jgi:hypothetical protein